MTVSKTECQEASHVDYGCSDSIVAYEHMSDPVVIDGHRRKLCYHCWYRLFWEPQE